MKKKLRLFIVLFITFIIGITNANAATLDCTTKLKKGSTGDSVKQLQALLNEKESCNLEEDGIFGSLTRSCVIKFQQDNNLSPDGIVGKNTCNMLNGTAKIVTTYQTSSATRAVVVVEEANIRTSATVSSQKLGTVKLGNIVRIVDETDNWYKIKSTGSTYGYIRKDLVAKNCLLVDISDQKLYVFEDGQKTWSTKVITGNKGNHDTPVGSYSLNPTNLQTDTYLKGNNDDGTKYSSHVDYWMPFITSRGIGFHDASWRYYDAYTTSTFNGNGSHGCVNMQHEAAEKLYNSITKTINVVVRD